MSKKQSSSQPPWAGRLPFEPDQKQPVKFAPDDCLTRLYGQRGHKVFTGTYLSTDKLSCSSFRVLPGCYFEPFDIHGGDEIYYVAAGSGAVFNPFTGRVYMLETGQIMWIPKGVWHQFYNFGEEETYVVTAFAPRMWSDMGTQVRFDGEPVLYNGQGVDWRQIPKTAGPVGEYSNQLGRFPVEGPPARQGQEMFVIRPNQAINLIHGRENRMLVSFFVSNDFVHAGVMTLPSRCESDDECHQGDELIYVAQGRASVVIKPDDFDSESVSVERFELGEGDRFFIPENTRHSYVNLSSANARIVFFVAPQL